MLQSLEKEITILSQSTIDERNGGHSKSILEEKRVCRYAKNIDVAQKLSRSGIIEHDGSL